MKYSKIVAHARAAAKKFNESYIVFECRAESYPFVKGFDYCSESAFRQHQERCPLIRLLLILPNGAIVQ